MLLLVTVLQAVHGDGDIKLDVHVKNYTSKYSYKIAREFTGYVNSTCSTRRFPIEGYLYTIENTTGPGYPPFRPNSTWIAFVPSSIDHLSLSLAASIRSAGYSVIMLDSSLSADTDVSEVNIPLVSVVNATDYFFALSTPSRSLRVRLSIRGSSWALTDSEYAQMIALYVSLTFGLMLSASLILAYYGLCRGFWRRRPSDYNRTVHELPVHAPSLHLVSLEENNSRRAAAELLDTIPLIGMAEQGDEDFGICSVCLTSVEKPDECKPLPCGHYFHPSCIDKWLVDHSFSCPVCRQDPRKLLPDLYSRV